MELFSDIIFELVLNSLKTQLTNKTMSGERIVKHQSQISVSEQDETIFKKQQSRLNTIVWMNMLKKQVMAVGFSGVIRSGIFKQENTLSVMYTLHSGPDWKIVGGQPSGISMKSTCMEEKIVWNFPFGVSYQAKTLHSWPQIVVVLYGTDYFGRSVPRGYGNVHLPTGQGTHIRKIRIFKPLQPTSFWSCINFFTSSVMQLSQPQKFLGASKQRKNLKVQYCGQIQLEVQTRLVNLSRHGYK